MSRPATYFPPPCQTVTFHTEPKLYAQRVCMNLGVTSRHRVGSYLFLTPHNTGAGICTDTGRLVWWRERPLGTTEEHDLTVMHVLGQRLLAVWAGTSHHIGNNTVTINTGTGPALRAMFSDAMSPRAGRLVDRNPFAGLALRKTRGNRGKKPPSEEELGAMITIAREITPPSVAAYFEFACLTGARPSEIDALRWDRVRFEDNEIDLLEQWNAKTRTFTHRSTARIRLPC